MCSSDLWQKRSPFVISENRATSILTIMFDSDNDLWVSGNKERFQDEKENAKEHSLSNDNANRKLKNAIFHVSVVDIR